MSWKKANAAGAKTSPPKTQCQVCGDKPRHAKVGSTWLCKGCLLEMYPKGW